ncbi:DUF4388 domain-containing protein [bacterium]|nr:DUF4388 domain-containing protein [bacterium]
MSFSGSFDDLFFSEVLQLVHLEMKTGTLDLWNSWDGKKVIFKEGNILMTGSMEKNEKLGDMLIESKVINEAQLREALKIQRDGKNTKRVGDILKDRYGISEGDIQTGLKDYMLESIFAIFSWEDGQFHFSNEMAKKEEHIPFPLNVSVENIIMEGSRRIDETSRITKEIPHNQFILKLNIELEGIENIDLHPDEWKVLSLVDDTKAIEDIKLLTGYTDFQLLKIVFSLKNTHVIVLDEAEQAS